MYLKARPGCSLVGQRNTDNSRFTSLYRDRCVTFDAIYAWEAEPAAKDWWEPVPDEERAKIRFYNAPVEETVNPGNRPSWGPRGPKRIFL